VISSQSAKRLVISLRQWVHSSDVKMSDGRRRPPSNPSGINQPVPALRM